MKESFRKNLINTGIGIAATVASFTPKESEAQLGKIEDKTKVQTEVIKEEINQDSSGNKYINKDNLKFFSDDFISDVALFTNKDNNLDMFTLIAGRSFIDNPDSKDKLMLIEGIEYSQEELSAKIDNDIKKEKENLTKEDKKMAKKRMEDLLGLVDEVKLKIIKHIKSNEYLEKLAKEMNISKEKAREYQNIRINNIQDVLLNFDYSKYLALEGAGAYYQPQLHKITLPYDIDIYNKKGKDYFCEILTHEVLHGLTRARVSRKADKIFKNSVKKRYNISGSDNKIKYDSSPMELIVRKQILDLELEKMGIKKYGDEFTEKHYEKLLELKDQNQLPNDILDLINHIKQENFSKMMNKLAESNDNNKDYHHPGWDYEERGNQT